MGKFRVSNLLNWNIQFMYMLFAYYYTILSSLGFLGVFLPVKYKLRSSIDTEIC